MPRKSPNSPSKIEGQQAPRSTSGPLSLSRVVTYIVAAIAIVIVLRFVFSIAMSILKFVIMGMLVLFVAWLFLSTDKSGKSGKSD